MTGDPRSTPAPGLPDLERELDRFRSIRQLKNHWARPAGRRPFYWYLTFDHCAELRSLVRKCQEAIAFPYYDLTDPSGVHMTLDGRPGRPWRPADERINELVFIGRNLDAAALRAGFDECRADELMPVA